MSETTQRYNNSQHLQGKLYLLGTAHSLTKFWCGTHPYFVKANVVEPSLRECTESKIRRPFTYYIR